MDKQQWDLEFYKAMDDKFVTQQLIMEITLATVEAVKVTSTTEESASNNFSKPSHNVR